MNITNVAASDIEGVPGGKRVRRTCAANGPFLERKLRHRDDVSCVCDLPEMDSDLGFNARLPGSGYRESGHFTPPLPPPPGLGTERTPCPS